LAALGRPRSGMRVQRTAKIVSCENENWKFMTIRREAKSRRWS
jgi:hypothetical protein